MTHDSSDAVRLDTVTRINWIELVNASGLPEAEVRELVQYGAITPCDPAAPAWTFESRCLVLVRTASRLRREYELDPHGVSVVLGYVERLEQLEAELRALRAQRG